MTVYGATTSPASLPRRGHPPAGRSREAALVRAAENGDALARDELVEVFLPLIGSVARVYRNSDAVSRHELMQEGVVGLLSALERFDAARGTPFWAYASWWVRQAMQSLVAQMTGPVVLSDRALRQLARIKAAQRAHLQSHFHEASLDDLVEATGFKKEHIQNLIAAELTPRALEEPVSNGDGTAPALSELIADPAAEDGFVLVAERMTVDALRALPGALSARERAVVRSRYGIGCQPETLRSIAGRLGVSAERVRQIEQQALVKLRAVANPAAGDARADRRAA
jgi:RNA polymerase primary sigma factor